MNKVSFWYPVKREGQMTFEGTIVYRDVIAGEGHILYQEVLLCRQSRERLKNEVKATKNKSVANKVKGIKLCKKCEEKYKVHPDLGWVHWIGGQAASKLHGVNE